MGDIFMKLLNTSITAGWLIVAVLCIRLVFRKMPKWVNCLLWGAVAFRLVCPFSIESPFSVLPSTEPIRSSTVVEGEVQNDIPSIDSHLTIVENTINPMLTEAFAYDQSNSAVPLQAPLQTVTYAAGFVWCCGMAFLIICAMVSAVRLHRLVREAVRIRDNIYICDAVTSPFILGIVNPRVYLSSALQGREADYILAHEAAHLKRKDHWWKALGYVLLCVYWFNPLCWAAYFMFCKDIELACDEKAAGKMTLQEKKEYSRVLLSCASPRRLIMVCPLAFGEVGVKERVKSVLHYKKPTLWIMIAAFMVLVVLAVCFLTNPAKEYQIKITIPAGSTEVYCYSDEEISPKRDTLTFYAGAGLEDTQIKLLPIEVSEENAYDEAAYITQGMPVKMDVEKGAWFKVGVNIQNPTDESRDVYISVRNVEVRIASPQAEEGNGQPSGQAPDLESAAQQETFADMQVSDALGDSGLIALSSEDAQILRTFLNMEQWEEGTADCLNNCELIYDGNTVNYHSDCGTFNDSVYNRHLSLREEDKTEVNAILGKYISLQSGDIPLENALTMSVLLELYENDGLAVKVEEEGLEGFLAYGNMELYSDNGNSLTGIYTCDLVYPHTSEDGTLRERHYELQLYYWRPETAEEYGHAQNEIDTIGLMEKSTGDAVLLYEEDERYITTKDLQGFLQRDYGISQYLSCNLPDGFTLGAFQSDLWYYGGWLLEGAVEAPVHDSEATPEAWYCPGGIGRVENADHILHFDNGRLTNAFLLGNHMGQVGETEILDGCEAQAVLAEYEFELFTLPSWEDYLLQHPGTDDNMSISHYWYVFLGKEDSETFYVLFLNQEYFDKDDAIRMAQSVRFTEKAF